MIENSFHDNWHVLQSSVCRLFNEIGLNANTEVQLKTPRGSVEVDVFAVDERSVDKIQYIVECKNWESAIPQHVVHSFTTIMHETGANIGYIVSKHGLQSGAIQYTKNTNIIGLTYAELQRRYFEPWWHNYYCKEIAKAAECVCFYTEPFNCRRNEALEKLTETELDRFYELTKKYAAFSMLIWHADLGTIMPSGHQTPIPIKEYKQKFIDAFGPEFTFTSIYYRDLLREITGFLYKAEQELNEIFGHNIFTEA